MFDYLQKQIQSPIIKILPENVDSKKSSIIGYFLDENSSNYQIFSKVANLLRDECEFIQLINSDQRTDFISYHSSNGKNIPYNGLLNNEESLYIWSNKNCIPLIKEITFENAEELTDEGLPFLILFHHENDQQSILLFEKEIFKQILHEKCMKKNYFHFRN
jgi:endoplasmic reticulum resident protein 44